MKARLLAILALFAAVIPGTIGHGISIWLRSRGGGGLPVAGALVWLNPTTLNQSTFAWSNDPSATGGATYDLTATNAGSLSVTTRNGLPITENTGTGYMTAVAVNIPNPVTMFIIAESTTNLADSAIFAEPPAQLNPVILRDSFLNSLYELSAGIVISTGPNQTGQIALFTLRLHADATSKIDVSDVGSTIGDAGTNTLDYIRIFADSAGGSNFQGMIGEVVIYGSALSDFDEALTKNFLLTKWGLPSSGAYSDAHSDAYDN